MEKIKQNALVQKVGFNRIVLIFVLLLMYLMFGLLTGGAFFGFSRIANALNYAYFLGFLSLGVTFVIATGGIDFSIGPVMFCCALVSGYSLTMYGVPMVISLVMSVLIGVLFGTFNGYLVAYWNVPPFIVSMASMNIAKGIAAVFTKTQSVSWPQSSTEDGWYRNFVSVNGFPIGLIVFLLVAVVCAVVLNQTKWGRYILCLGSNEEAVRLSGVNVKRWKMLAYIICGTLVGIASIYFVAAYTTVQPGYGDQYNNEAIAGCVMEVPPMTRHGWYFHGRRPGIYQRHGDWRVYHFSFATRYSRAWIYERIPVHYYRFDCYRGGLRGRFRKAQEELGTGWKNRMTRKGYCSRGHASHRTASVQ